MPECFCPSQTTTGLEGAPQGEDNEQGAVAVMYEKAMHEREVVRGSAEIFLVCKPLSLENRYQLCPESALIKPTLSGGWARGVRGREAAPPRAGLHRGAPDHH